MIIAGIDPGSRFTGFGVIRVEGTRCSCVDFSCIAGTGVDQSSLFADRLNKIYTELVRLLASHKPAEIAVESVFHAVNAKTALKLGQARGVAVLAAAQTGAPLFEYSPLEVKKSVVGYGRAQKNQVQMMVRTLLNMKETPKPHDAADALAIALCHAFNRSRDRRSPQRWRNLR